LTEPSKKQALARALTLLFAIGAVVLLVLSRRVPNCAGSWRVDLARPGDVTLHTYFVLQQAGRKLEGKVIVNGSVDLPLRDAHFEKSEAVFGDDWGTQYRLRSQEGRLLVSLKKGSHPREEAVAIRIPEMETNPPAPLPLPSLGTAVSNGLALTPPMGWSSWNHFEDQIDASTVRETADALVSSGLAAAGYVQVNIDDGWQGGRDADGNLISNAKFPDMKALGDYLHERGLKFGLYSSPGPRTCAGYEGSFGHEEQDARTFAAWGVDYLKYDWCSAARVYPNRDFTGVYRKMGRALAQSGRAIVYSVCQYGLEEVWKWGPQTGANLWRTTYDIRDNWKAMSEIGFNQSHLASFAGPGHWNDPDMLEVGNGGMTATEYRTHFSLWCLLAAPLVAGHDVRTMTAETREILANHELIAIDQDRLGKQAVQFSSRNGVEVWTKPLQDGGVAVGLFNRSETRQTAVVTWKELGRQGTPNVRDLWQHSEVTSVDDRYSGEIPAHGCVVLRVK
jgi:alpha-galactosidase